MTDIAFFIPSLEGGGAEKMVLALANYFALQGLKIDLVLLKRKGVYIELVNENVRIIDLNASRALTSIPKLVKYFKSNKPTSVLSALSHINTVCVIAQKLSGVDSTIIVSQRNIFTQSVPKGVKGQVIRQLTKWAYNSSSCVVAISQGVKDDLVESLKIKEGHIYKIYNPALPDKTVLENKDIPSHDYFSLKERPKVILAVGRLNVIKDFANLINAIAIVNKNINVRLIILGEGPERSNLERIIDRLHLSNIVSMPGFTNNPYNYMHNSDLFVSTSVSEGFGNAIVEAMACGLPIISTDCPSGPAEILERGKWGRLVPIGDTIALANEIVTYLNNDNYPDVLSRSKDFSIENISIQYFKVLNSRNYAKD